MICRICASNKTHKKFIVSEMMFGFKDKFDYFQCADCACLQIDAMPSNISKYYPENYYSFAMCPPAHKVARFFKKQRDNYVVLKKGFLGRVLAKIKPPEASLVSLFHLNLRGTERILDVGCGSGRLLSALSDLGFKNILGVDPFGASDIRLENGVNILKRSVSEVSGEWDVIMFHHSLEHIYDQKETLRAAWALLAETGVCFVRVPVASSFAWQYYGVCWVQLDAPRHLYLHSLESMEKLASEAGFFIEKIIFDSWEFQFCGSELYLKGIHLMDPKTGVANPDASIFSTEQKKWFRQRAQFLNETKQGDQAIFFLKKKK